MKRSRDLATRIVLICLIGVLPVVPAAPAGASGFVNIFVGYADTLRGASAQFPTPWEGSPGVTYQGCSPSADCSFDAGAVRIENGTEASQTITDVKVNVDTCTYDLWTFPVILAPGNDLILTQTISGGTDGCQTDGSMDTSDVGPGGVAWDDGNCNPDGILPTVDVTVAGLGTTTSTDSGQVLNTGGVDGYYCSTVSSNESQSWTPIGHPPPACSPATLTLSPPGQSESVGTTRTVTGNFSNSCGPLSNTTVNFSVTNGPNAGRTGSGTTDSNGSASFSYSSARAGTDTLQASVTNPNGDITSNFVAINWAIPCSGYDAVVIGVRGTGDNSNGDDYPDRHAKAIAALLASDWHLKLYDDDGVNDHVIGLSYPAVSLLHMTETLGTAYDVSLNSGVSNLISRLQGLRALCGPRVPLLLVGFSQGAQVVQTALNKMDNDASHYGSLLSSIAGAAVIASPRFDHNDTVARGTFLQSYPYGGLFGESAMHGRFASDVRSYCLANDPVCVSSPGTSWHALFGSHTRAYDDCDLIPADRTCHKTTLGGQEVTEDAASLLAWDVESRLGKKPKPHPDGQFAAYLGGTRRQSTVRLSAASLYSNGAPSEKFGWDFTSRGRADVVTYVPWTSHSYGHVSGKVNATVRITYADGSVTTHTVCIQPNFGASRC